VSMALASSAVPNCCADAAVAKMAVPAINATAHAEWTRARSVMFFLPSSFALSTLGARSQASSRVQDFLLKPFASYGAAPTDPLRTQMILIRSLELKSRPMSFRPHSPVRALKEVAGF
jgi:hypothetical protein